MQAELTKGMTHGLTIQVSYTYSHALDTASSFEDYRFWIQRPRASTSGNRH